MKSEWITDNVIDLAKRLHELGYRKRISYGDWYIPEGLSLTCLHTDLRYYIPESDNHVPIPTLSQCLRWLTENGDPDEIDLAPYGNIWRIHYDCFTYTHAEAPTPEEAAMLAMIKILKGEGK